MKEIRQLENCLENGIMFGINGKNIPFLRDNETDKNLSEERRSFLKKGVGLTGGILFGGIGVSDSVEGSTFKTDRPKYPGPGIMNLRDPLLRSIGRSDGTYDMYGSRMRQVLSKYDNYTNIRSASVQESLRRETPLIEPFVYFLSATLNVGDPYSREMGEKNLSMKYFYKTILSFSNTWIQPNELYPLYNKQVSLGWLAMCVAAYGTKVGEARGKAMEKASFDQMKEEAKLIVSTFQSKKGYNKNSTDPQNPYNQALVANWAAYVITNHHESLHNGQTYFRRVGGWGKVSKEVVDFYNEELLKPLEKFTYRVKPEGRETYSGVRTY